MDGSQTGDKVLDPVEIQLTDLNIAHIDVSPAVQLP
jgi:hypothetical protein